MRPAFRIWADELDTTRQMNNRLLEILVVDQPDLQNDRLTLVFDDRPPYMQIPQTGIVLEIELGYMAVHGHLVPSPMQKMGTFVFDEFEVGKGPEGRTLKMTAHADDTEGTFKQSRSDAYINVSVLDVIRRIAARNRYKYVVDKEVGDKRPTDSDFEHQTNMGDDAYLTRLAFSIGASMKLRDRTIFFGPRNQLAAMIGKVLPDVEIYDNEILDYKIVSQGKGRYTAVRAYYYDKDGGERAWVFSTQTESRRETYYTLLRTYPTEEEAKQRAEAKKVDLDNAQASLRFTCVGNSKLMAESTVVLKNFRPGVITRWQLTKVTHRFTKAGYITECSAENPLSSKGLTGIYGEDFLNAPQ